MADEVKIPIRADESDLKRGLANSQGLIQRFGGAVKNTFAVIGGVASARQLYSWVSGFIDSANEAQEALTKLEHVVKTTGGAAGLTAAQLAGIADRLEGITNVSSETIQAGQAILLTFKRVRGDEFERANAAALDMAKTMGGDVVGSMRMVGRALEDPIRGVDALGRSNVRFTTAQRASIREFVAQGDIMKAQGVILGEIESRYKGTAEALAGTAAGQWLKFKTTMGNVGEEIGLKLLPAMNAIAPALEAMGRAVSRSISGIIEWGAAFNKVGLDIREHFGPALEWLAKGSEETVARLQIVFYQLPLVARKVGLDIEVAMWALGENLRHLFTKVIPAYAQYFAENWVDIFRDMADYTGVVLKNMGKNIWDFLTEIKALFSGKGFNFQFTALTEGFESSLTKMPEIAKRVVGETERALQHDLDQAKKRLAAAVSEQKAANRDFVGDFLGDGKVGAGKDEGGATVAKVDPNEVKGLLAAKKGKLSWEEEADAWADKVRAGKGSGSGDKAAATFEGIEDVNKRIQAAAATKGKPPEDKIVDELKKGWEYVKKQAAASEQLQKLQEGATSAVKETVGVMKGILEAMPGVGGLK